MDKFVAEHLKEYESDINECLKMIKKNADDCRADLSNLNNYLDFIVWLANRIEKDVNSYTFYKSL